MNEHIELALQDADVQLFDIPFDQGVNCNPLERLDGLDVAPEDRERVMHQVEACARAVIPRFVVEYRAPDYGSGRVRWRQARGSLVRDEHGIATRLVGASQDITPLKESQEETLRLRRQIQQAELEQSEQAALRGEEEAQRALERAKSAEEESQRAIDLLKLATSLSEVTVWTFDLAEGDLASAKAVFVNLAESLGYGPEDMPADLAASVELTVLAEDRPALVAAVQAYLQGRTERFEHECRVRRKDGTVEWQLARGVAIRDANGRPTRFTGTSVFVTRIKQAEAALRATNESFDLAVRLFDFRVTDIELHGAASPAQAATNAAGDLGGRGLRYMPLAAYFDYLNRVVLPEDLPRVRGLLEGALRGEIPEISLECRVRASPGDDYRWRFGRIKLYFDEIGTPERCISFSHDIQPLKEAEEEAQRMAQQLRLATDLSGVQIWGYDLGDVNEVRDFADLATAKTLFVDKIVEDLGYEGAEAPADLVGRLGTIFLPEERPRLFEAVRDCLSGRTTHFESAHRLIQKNGETRWKLSRGIVTRDATGRPLTFMGTAVDITQLKQTEEELQRVKDRLELAVQGSKACTWDFDVPDGQVVNGIPVFTNAWELCGYEVPSDPRLAGQVFSILLPAEDLGPFTQGLQAFFDGTEREWEGEQRVVHKDRRERWLLGRGVVVRNERGRVTRFIGAAVDITDRKLVERALSESEERFRRTFENAAVGMILTDTDGNPIEYNRRFCEFLGYSPEELAGRRLVDFMEAHDAALHLEQQQRVVRGEAPSFTRDTRYFRKDGAVVWGCVTVSAIQRHPDGSPAHLLGILLDMTGRKALEAEIRQGRETLELAMRGSDVSVVVVDIPGGNLHDSRWTLFNFWEPMGIDPFTAPTDFGGRTKLSIHPEDRDAVVASFRRAAQYKRPNYYVEHRFFHADGSLGWRLSRGTLLYDATGNVSRFIATAIDITRLKQIESELSRAREAAEAANRAKDEFLANVSHEIRTPMNAILGMTELALDSTPSDHQRQLLSTVRSAAKNLLGIINDLLDFSKIAAGKLTLDRAPFSLRTAVGDTLRALSVRAHRKGLELLCQVQPDVPDALDGDAGRLRQVLMNLVGNAIKFTQRGEIEVDVGVAPSSRESLDTADVQLVFTVRDTGIGIAAEKQASIFRAFEQGDSSTTRQYGGTGLGLTISAQLAALMNGSISVESAPGRGSKFRFIARLARSAGPEAVTTSPERLAELRVLIVDDDETNRRILEEWLTSWRMQPTAVGNAAAVMEALTQAHDTGSPFALVLLDARMPDVDGVTLAGQIRQQWGPRAPRLILLSSGDDPGLVAKSRLNGVLVYLLKPVQQSELLEAIWAAMNMDLTLPSKATQSAESPERLPPLNFLVAEDNDLNVALLDELLRQRGHHPQFARDGRAALDLALRLAPEAACDLMLLDLHMPGLDGFEVARAIREHEQGTTRHLPIVALTARSSPRDRERCIAAGMDEFLSKPIEVAALWATVERLIRRWPPVRGASAQVDSGLLDPRAILRACDGQASLLAKILVVLRESLPNHLARIRSALSVADFVSLGAAAHELAGTVGLFSTVTADIALTLEDEAVRQDLESCTALSERLGSMCDALVDETATLTLDSLQL